MTKVYYIEPQHFDEAAANGISADCLRDRVHKLGWDIEDAVAKPPRHRDGYYWHMAQAHGIKRTTYYERLKLGWTKEAAATTPAHSAQEAMRIAKQHQERLFTDEEWAIARANGVSRGAMYWRVHHGWSKERTIHTPPLPRTNRTKARSYFQQAIQTDVNQHA